ncbi:MAG: HD-GYP domain-containing protein [Oscillospiraceae bacterium]
MIIVPIDNLTEGMVLARDVASTSARDYKTLLMKGTVITADMITLLKSKGIKTVTIKGEEAAGQKPVQLPMEERSHVETAEQIKNQHIGRALNELSSVFEHNGEIKELSQKAIEQVDRIADDILVDIGNDSSYLGNQMIALQNYDDYTYKHCLRVAMLSTSIAHELGLSPADIKEVIVAALLHDIGKSNIDHEIIVKPGKLTEEEYEKIKKHPYIGYEILKKTGGYSSNVMAGVLFHQEKFDGSGYPTGLAGKKIPLVARILTVADVFDALTSNRPYRRPWSVAETEEYMLGGCGMHFDYDVTAAFLRSFNPYPVGTMVSLSDGRHGVVIRHNANVLRPVIRIRGENTAEEIDLSNDFRFLSLMVTGIYSGNYAI